MHFERVEDEDEQASDFGDEVLEAGRVDGDIKVDCARGHMPLDFCPLGHHRTLSNFPS